MAKTASSDDTICPLSSMLRSSHRRPIAMFLGIR